MQQDDGALAPAPLPCWHCTTRWVTPLTRCRGRSSQFGSTSGDAALRFTPGLGAHGTPLSWNCSAAPRLRGGGTCKGQSLPSLPPCLTSVGRCTRPTTGSTPTAWGGSCPTRYAMSGRCSSTSRRQSRAPYGAERRSTTLAKALSRGLRSTSPVGALNGSRRKVARPTLARCQQS